MFLADTALQRLGTVGAFAGIVLGFFVVMIVCFAYAEVIMAAGIVLALGGGLVSIGLFIALGAHVAGWAFLSCAVGALLLLFGALASD